MREKQAEHRAKIANLEADAEPLYASEALVDQIHSLPDLIDPKTKKPVKITLALLEELDHMNLLRIGLAIGEDLDPKNLPHPK